MSNITHLSPARDPINQAIDTANLSYSSITDLETLFCAIRDTSDKDTPAHKLAAIGIALAQDLANAIDCEREDLEGLRAHA